MLLDARFEPDDSPGAGPNDQVVILPGAETRTYPLIWLPDAAARIGGTALIRGLINPGTMIVCYGESNSGKTFHVLDRDLCLAAGVHWYGRETQPGFVLYIAAEGAHSVENRVVAYRDTFLSDCKDVPFAILPRPIDLLREDADTDGIIDFIKAIQDKRGIQCVKVTADTLARTMAGGNENDPGDMGALVMHADRIRHAFGCAFEFVHHAGKDTARGARGHSSLRAATDTEIEVAIKDGVHTATVTKQRDLQIGDVFCFTLRVLDLGADTYGHPTTTCVPEWVEGQPGSGAQDRLTKTEARFLDLLREAIRDHGTLPPRAVLNAPDKPDKPGQNRSVRPGMGQKALSAEKFRGYIAAAGGLTESDKPDTERRTFKRCVQNLQSRAIVGFWEGLLWLPDKPDKPGQNRSVRPGTGLVRPDRQDTPLKGCPPVRSASVEGESGGAGRTADKDHGQDHGEDAAVAAAVAKLNAMGETDPDIRAQVIERARRDALVEP